MFHSGFVYVFRQSAGREGMLDCTFVYKNKWVLTVGTYATPVIESPTAVVCTVTCFVITVARRAQVGELNPPLAVGGERAPAVHVAWGRHGAPLVTKGPWLPGYRQSLSKCGLLTGLQHVLGRSGVATPRRFL